MTYTRVPRFSILLPTHNRAEVLTLALRSILAQTEPDFEVLVVGDGCTDDTAAVVAAFRDNRLRWFDLPKAPHFGYANRNLALQQAQGELIAFLAHDDLWTADHLALLSACFEDHRIDIAYTRPFWITGRDWLVPLTFDLHDPDVRESFLTNARDAIPASCVIHRRSCFDRYGYWNADLPEKGDRDLWARIISGGGKGNFAYLPTPTCLHFRAIWRTEDNEGPVELRRWVDLADMMPSVMAELGVTRPSSRTQQEAFWHAMHCGGDRWTQKLRAVAGRLLDARIEATDHSAVVRRGPRVGALADVPAAAVCRVRFGAGFHAAESGFRWMERDGVMTLSLEQPQAKVLLTLVCSEARHYRSFPFGVQVEVDGTVAGTLTFDADHQARQIALRIAGRSARIRCRSTATFVPAAIGLNADSRELSVRLTDLQVNTELMSGEDTARQRNG